MLRQSVDGRLSLSEAGQLRPVAQFIGEHSGTETGKVHADRLVGNSGLGIGAKLSFDLPNLNYRKFVAHLK